MIKKNSDYILILVNLAPVSWALYKIVLSVKITLFAIVFFIIFSIIFALFIKADHDPKLYKAKNWEKVYLSLFVILIILNSNYIQEQFIHQNFKDWLMILNFFFITIGIE